MGSVLKSFIRKLRFYYLTKIKWRRYTFGKNPYIGRFVSMWAKQNIRIGDSFYIGKFSQIECDADIGNYVMFGNRVALVGRYDHNYQQLGDPVRLSISIRDKNYDWQGNDNKVIIEDDVWVGFGAIILSGVKIGKGSIIAAGSIVTKDVEPFSIYAGVPAKKKGNRFKSEIDMKRHIELYNTRYLHYNL